MCLRLCVRDHLVCKEYPCVIISSNCVAVTGRVAARRVGLFLSIDRVMTSLEAFSGDAPCLTALSSAFDIRLTGKPPLCLGDSLQSAAHIDAFDRGCVTSGRFFGEGDVLAYTSANGRIAIHGGADDSRRLVIDVQRTVTHLVSCK